MEVLYYETYVFNVSLSLNCNLSNYGNHSQSSQSHWRDYWTIDP